MFMRFQTCGTDGNPENGNGNILLDMKKVDVITQTGYWDHRPRPIDRAPTEEVNNTDRYIVIGNCVTICCKHTNYIVIADFNELATMLESLNSLYGE